MPPGSDEAKEHHHFSVSEFAHSIADSMRESSGIERHDAHPHAHAECGLSADAEAKPGIVSKIKDSISGVSHATQEAGWGGPVASGGGADVKESAPLGEAAVDVGADVPAVSASLSAPSADVDADLPEAGAGAGLTLPSGSVGIGGEC